MLKIENTVTPSADWWKAVVNGVRNPYNSWDKSDSYYTEIISGDYQSLFYCLGDNDLELMKKLAKAGDDHGKFLRMIPVVCDITAPLYWWKEMDTYKVGTVADSCSTMHTIAAKEFTLDDFSTEHLLNTGLDLFEFTWDNGMFARNVQPLDLMLMFIIPSLNRCRQKYLETKDKEAWWQLIQLLPSSYNQKRTWNGNYQVLYHIYRARNKHRLDEWETMRQFIRTLPYSEIITGEENA